MKRFSILLTLFLLVMAGSAAAQEERELTKAEKKAFRLLIIMQRCAPLYLRIKVTNI